MPYDLVEEMKSIKQNKDKQIRFFRELKRIFPDAIEVAYLKSVKRLEALSEISQTVEVVKEKSLRRLDT